GHRRRNGRRAGRPSDGDGVCDRRARRAVGVDDRRRRGGVDFLLWVLRDAGAARRIRQQPLRRRRVRADKVYLVGFMAAGKTTVARALAARLDWQAIDIDELIEKRE